MAGHSKWNNIKRKKEKTDHQKAKIFTKIGREMMVAIKEGGPDPSGNKKLRDLIAKAKSNNVPNDNIQRLIKKTVAEPNSTIYETVFYEGYGPDGVAILVEVLTDNRNRTTAFLRHTFDKYGGNLGTSGCVAYLFEKTGVIFIEKKDAEEEYCMEQSMLAGAKDVVLEDDFYKITTEAKHLETTIYHLDAAKIIVQTSSLEYVPNIFVKLDEGVEQNMKIIIERLEDCDDVIRFWHNWE